jgi:isopenicillin N synthase-like dioxygenase
VIAWPALPGKSPGADSCFVAGSQCPERKLTGQDTPNLDDHPVAQSSALARSVPVVDLGGLIDGQATTVIGEVAAACREWGFFQVVNHGVADELIDNVWRHTRRFFRLPRDAKVSIRRTRENPWGYYDNELTKNQRDKKEVFDYTNEGVDPIYRSENRWPDTNDAFRATMLAYLEACTELSLRLLEAFCAGLDLPADGLKEHFIPEHTGFIRLNHYPVADPMACAAIENLSDAGFGVHHHTDAGALTILLQDKTGGLQVHKDDCWHDVPPLEGAFVINTGDMMQVWSNDIYQAATHRVLAMENRGRYSIPFFFNPAAKTRVRPLQTAINESRPCAYRAIEWAEFRGKRTDGDYADYGAEIQISQYRLGVDDEHKHG